MAKMACLGRFQGNRSGCLHMLACNQDFAAMRDIQLWASATYYQPGAKKQIFSVLKLLS